MNGKSATEFKEMKDEMQRVGQCSTNTDENSNGASSRANNACASSSDNDALKEFFHTCTFKQH